MFSRTKAVYLIGSLILGLLTISIVFVGLIAGGVINVVRTELVLTAGSAEKYYDGKELTCDDWSLTYGALKAGHTMEVVVSGSQVEAGVGVNYVFATIKDENGVDVTEDYSISYQYGELKVNPRIITITGGGANKYYDGTPLSSSDYIVAGTTIGNDKLQVSTSGSQIDAGTGKNIPTAIVVDAEGNDIGKNYQLVCKPGDLVVNPIPITFESLTKEKKYDATELDSKTDDNAAWISFGELLSGHEFIYDITGSITDAGTVDNTFNITIFDKNDDNRDVTGNYDIKYNTGTLTVLPVDLTLYTESQTWEYDAEEHKNNEYRFEAESTISKFGLTFEVTFLNTITNAGTVENSATYAIIDKSLEDITKNFNVTNNFGTLTVEKKKLVIPTESAAQDYNGKALSRTAIDKSKIQGQIVDGHNFTAEVTGSITNYFDDINGETPNQVLVVIKDAAGNLVTENYDIDASSLGILKINPVEIVFTAATNEKTYDGKPLTDPNFIYDSSVLVNGETLQAGVVVNGTISSVGSVANEIDLNSIVIKDALGNITTNNYLIKCIAGKLTINPIKLTYASETRGKTYDGTPFSSADDTFVRVSGNLLSGHIAEILTKTELTVAENKPVLNEFTIKITDGQGNDLTDNYSIIKNYGTLTYSPKSVKFKSISKSKAYDGTPLSTATIENAVTLVSGTLASGHRWEAISFTELSSCGSEKNDFTINIYDENDILVASSANVDISNYQIIKDCGTLGLTKRSFTISSNSKTKEYDGLVLKANDNDYITSGDLAPGDVLAVDFNEASLTGITEVGKISNSFTFSIKNSENVDISTTCYAVTINIGDLEVTKCTITLKSEGGSKQFDGSPLTNSVVYLESGALAQGHTLSTLTATGTITNAGEIVNEITFEITDTESQVVVSNSISNKNYEVLLDEGLLTVTPYESTIMTKSYQFTYDGNVHYGVAGESGMSNINIMSGHTIHQYPTVTGCIEFVGTQENTVAEDIIIWDAKNNDVTQNYKFTYTYGTLTMAKKAITFTAGSLYGNSSDYTIPVTYNAKPSYLAEEMAEKDELSSWLIVGNCTLYNYEIPNILSSVRITRKNNTSTPGLDVTDQYDITKIDGIILISSDLAPTSTGLSVPDGYVPDDTTPVMSVYSTKTGSIYLKQQSVGDYNGSGFDPGITYGYDKSSKTQDLDKLLDGIYSANYLTSNILGESGISTYNVQVTPQVTSGYYLLPSYVKMNDATLASDGKNYVDSNGSGDYLGAFGVQTNDVANTYFYKDENNKYSFSLYDYDYLSFEGVYASTTYTSEFAAYKTWVESNYKAVPTKTGNYLSSLISTNGWDTLSTTKAKVAAVRSYLMNASNFTYCLDYDRALDQQDDIVVAFLGLYKTGVCRHFAASATMIYRALGIPARYVIGYRADILNANADNNVTMSKGHAWVEIFDESVGWVTIDVTPAVAGPSNKSTVEDSINLVVKPNDKSVKWVDASTTAQSDSYMGLTGFLTAYPNYHVDTCTIAGAQIGEGVSNSYIASLIIKNAEGDVVYSYAAIANGVGREVLDTIGLNIEYRPGVLKVYVGSIEIKTSSATKVYDGSELTKWEFTYNSETYTSDENGNTFKNDVASIIMVDSNVAMKVKFVNSRETLGIVNNTVLISFYNSDGSTYGELVDGTKYNVVITNGRLTIEERPIIVDIENHIVTGIAPCDQFNWAAFEYDEEEEEILNWDIRRISSDVSVADNYLIEVAEA